VGRGDGSWVTKNSEMHNWKCLRDLYTRGTAIWFELNTQSDFFVLKINGGIREKGRKVRERVWLCRSMDSLIYRVGGGTSGKGRYAEEMN
jgi:hypothetical protein